MKKDEDDEMPKILAIPLLIVGVLGLCFLSVIFYQAAGIQPAILLLVLMACHITGAYAWEQRRRLAVAGYSVLYAAGMFTFWFHLQSSAV